MLHELDVTGKDVVAWRRRMGWGRKLAAGALDLGLSTLQNYERGSRSDGKSVEVPVMLAYACVAIEAGLKPIGRWK